MNQKWTLAPSGLITLIVGAVVVTAYAFVVAGPEFGLVMLVLCGVGLYVFGFRPSVTLTDSEVIVRNPAGTKRIPLSDIEGIGGAYAGLSIQRRSGGSVAAWAVQKSNAAKWAGKRTRADEVSDAILAAQRS